MNGFNEVSCLFKEWVTELPKLVMHELMWWNLILYYNTVIVALKNEVESSIFWFVLWSLLHLRSNHFSHKMLMCFFMNGFIKNTDLIKDHYVALHCSSRDLYLSGSRINHKLYVYLLRVTIYVHSLHMPWMVTQQVQTTTWYHKRYTPTVR